MTRLTRRAYCVFVLTTLVVSATACTDESGYTILVTFKPTSLSREVDRISVTLLESCTETRGKLGQEVERETQQFNISKDNGFEGSSDIEPGSYGFYAIGLRGSGGDCRIAAACKENLVVAGGKGLVSIELEEIPHVGCEDASVPEDAGRRDAGTRRDAGPFDANSCQTTGAELCNGEDDDCDGDVDEDFTFATNPDYCGGCTVSCDENEGCGDGTCVPLTLQLASGAEHSCAVRVDGRVLCWGNNDTGQLGIGYTSPPVPLPIRIEGLTDVQQVAAGGYSTCALRTNGTAKCWGLNVTGALGDGSFADSSSPVDVVDLSDIRTLGPGPLHNCAIRENGRVMCWGSNVDGELGTGVAGGYRTEPQLVLNVTNAIQVQGGYQFTCALVESGEMFCWGRNQYGQLGNALYTNNATPQQVYGLNDIKNFSPGGGHVCAVREQGEIVCWGDGQFGQLSNYGIQLSSVPFFTGIRNGDVASATNPLACALLTNGTVSCWGGPPTAIPNLTDAVGISLAYGDGHTCAIRANRNVVCWGRNQKGQLGIGTVDSADHLPETVLGL